MAQKNICDVELLSEMTANDNVIVDHSGVTRKLNLKSEFDSVKTELEPEITNTGTMAIWKYPDGRLEIFGTCVLSNANGFVAEAGINLPVSVLINKPYSLSVSRNSMGNGVQSFTIIPTITLSTTVNNVCSRIAVYFQSTDSATFATNVTNSGYLTACYMVKGYWK